MSSSLSIPDLGNRLPSETNIESSHNYVPVKSKLLRPPTGIPRAFDYASWPERREFKCGLGRMGNLNQFISCSGVIRP